MPTQPPPEKTGQKSNFDVIAMCLLGMFAVMVFVVGSFGMGELRGRNKRAQEIFQAAKLCDDMNAMGFGDLPGAGGYYTDANCRTIHNLAFEKKFYDDGKAD